MPEAGTGTAQASERQPLLGRSGRTAISSPSADVACSAAVLLAELLERTAFYGLAGNLVLYLTESPLCWSNASAMTALLVLQGATYGFGLLGGWLSDSVTGKYGCILFGYLVYLVGYSFLFIHGYYLSDWSSMHKNPVAVNSTARCDDEHRTQAMWCTRLGSVAGDCKWSLYLSILLVGWGAALVRTNLGPFGADQVRGRGTRPMQSFFNWYYWCINVGACAAYTAVAYVQQFVDFAFGYLVPFCCLSLSVVVFVAGSRSYKVQTPVSGAVFGIATAIKRSFSRSNGAVIPDRGINYSGSSSSTSSSSSSSSSAEGLSFEDIKALKQLAIVFLLLLPYWICYFQMLGNTFLLQGLHMELTWGSGTIGVPAASLMLFNIIFLIVALPVVDRWLYPMLSRRRSGGTSAGLLPSVHMRVTVGMLFAALALAAASVVEFFRQQLISSNQTIVQVIGDTVYDDVAPISVFVQIPQYALLGVSEVFTCVSGIEYAYSRSPKSMESFVMGGFWFVAGVGSLLGTGIMNAVSGGQRSYNSCPDDLSAYFYALLCLQLFGAAVFYVAGRKLDLGVRTSRNSTPANSVQNSNNSASTGSGRVS